MFWPASSNATALIGWNAVRYFLRADDVAAALLLGQSAPRYEIARPAGRDVILLHTAARRE